MRKINLTIILLLTFLLLTVGNLFAAPPAGYEIQTIVSGLDAPTAMAVVPDGRIFVALKAGKVLIIKNSNLIVQPLLSLTDINSYGDRGLLGLTIDPDFSINGYIYLMYVYENTPGSNFSGTKTSRIVRYAVVGDTVDLNTKLVLMGTVGGSATNPSCANFATGTDCIYSDSSSHSVGALRFGADGKLYASMGDGANFAYPDPVSLRVQDPDFLSGKIFRINKDGTGPSDNPFFDGNPNSNRSKVYATGFRNPFRFNISPITNTIYVGDVGLATYEELNKINPGENYGWPCYEGSVQTPSGLNCLQPATQTLPFYSYTHIAPYGGAIIGGSFIRPNAYTADAPHTMFIGDYAQNWIKKIILSNTGDQLVSVEDFEMTDANGPVDFVTGPDGIVYFISIYNGSIRKIISNTGNRPPIVSVSSNVNGGTLPLSVNFTATSTDPDGDSLGYVWNFGDGATSTIQNPNYVFTTPGVKNVSVTVSDGVGGVTIKNISIDAGNQAPKIIYIKPANGVLYANNQSITASAFASDLEDGAIPESSYSWRYILHHNTHTHIIQVATGSTMIINTGDHQDVNVFIELELTVKDSNGLTSIKSTNLNFNENIASTTNQILNPSVEIADPALNQEINSPLDWVYDSYKISGFFSYPVMGRTGLKALKVTLSSLIFPEGYMKWHFTALPVGPNLAYTYSDYYKSDTDTNYILNYTLADGSKRYIKATTTASSTDWKKTLFTFTTPEDAKNLTIMHEIDRPGTLTTDDFFFAAYNPNYVDPFFIPTATPTATTSIQTVNTAVYSENLIQNSSVETSSTTVVNMPHKWLKNKWGINTGTLNYDQINGFDSNKKLNINVTSFTSGDVKWLFDYIPVVSTSTYVYSFKYKGNATSSAVVRFVDAAGAFTHSKLADLAPSSNWQNYTATITPRQTTKSISILNLLERVGNLDLDEFSLRSFSVKDIPVNVVENKDLESGGNKPNNFTYSAWGTTAASSSFPAFSWSTGKAARVDILTKGSGDAKWIMDSATVTPGVSYFVGNDYKSSTTSEFIIKYDKINGSVQYVLQDFLPSTQGFVGYIKELIIPSDVAKISILHIIKEAGYLITDNYFIRKK